MNTGDYKPMYHAPMHDGGSSNGQCAQDKGEKPVSLSAKSAVSSLMCRCIHAPGR